MSKILLSLVSGLVFSLMGCRPSLVPDSNSYSIFSNYPTAEVIACGKRMNVGSCAAVIGTPLNDINLQIQGYFDGTARIYSEECQLDYTVRFNQSRLFKVPLPGKVKNSCVIAIAITPEFPEERESGIIIGALEAFIRVRAIESEARYFSFVSKIPSESNDKIEFVSEGGRLIIRGCDAQIDKKINAGVTTIELKDFPERNVSRCIYEGAVIGSQSNILFSWLVWKYEKNYVTAATPVVEEDGNDIIVSADPATFVLTFDDIKSDGSQASFDFDKTKPHILRAITVSGRNVIGEYTPNRGWRWIK